MSLLDELALVNTHSIRNLACLFICPHFKATFISIRYDISLFKEKQWNVQTMLHFLLMEFKFCTVSYGLSFSAWIYKMRFCKSQQDIYYISGFKHKRKIPVQTSFWIKQAIQWNMACSIDQWKCAYLTQYNKINYFLQDAMKTSPVFLI